jgi:hypothetical protein
MTTLDVERALFWISLCGVALSLVLVANAFRNTIYAGVMNGDAIVITRGHLRSEVYRFFTQMMFLAVSVSFLSTATAPPLGAGGERVVLFTLGAAFILVSSIDSYLTTRHLLHK